MIRIKDLSLSYTPEEKVLNSINCTLLKGKIYGIAGMSGAGKSSLLKIIGGFINQSSGKVFLDGKELPFASQRLIPGHPSIALVPQDFKLDLYHTCIENIRESILNWEPTKRERRIQTLMRLFNLTGIQNTKANVLSGGEQQRLALARALAPKPDWLLLDEPFSHLDSRLRIKLTNIIQKLMTVEEIGVILVSHDAQDMLGSCDLMAFLRKGILSGFEDPFKRYLSLKNMSEASWFGIVNSVKIGDIRYRFRPNFFELSTSGLSLTLTKQYFNGTTFIHYFYTANDEEVVLFYPSVLPEKIVINLKNALEIK